MPRTKTETTPAPPMDGSGRWARRRMQVSGHFARGILGLLVLTGSSGCFFETREPERINEGEVCYEARVAERADIVFENLDGSLDCFQTGTYVEELTEDFRYLPPPTVSQGAPNPWTKATERLFVDRLFADSDSVESHLVNREIDVSGTDLLQVEAEYRIRVVTDGNPTEYVGEAFYRLRQEGSRWKMFEWEEKDSQNPLGQLKVGLVGGG